MESLIVFLGVSVISGVVIFIVALPYFFKDKAGTGRISENESDDYSINKQVDN